MENKELLSKISHNKVFLFIVPNLIYIYKFCSFYNSNSDVDHALEMNFRELFFLSLMFFFITSFVYFILNKALKDYQKVFCVSSIICCFYFFKFTLIQFLLFIVCVLILMIDLNTIIQILLDNLECRAIVLFGSYARGTQNKESDIDIAIKPKKEIDKKKLYEISRKLEDKLNKDIDLINLDEIGDTFRYEILINGKTLYCEDETEFELYKLDMYREFLELNESRQMIIDNIKKGGDIYGE